MYDKIAPQKSRVTQDLRTIIMKWRLTPLTLVRWFVTFFENGKQELCGNVKFENPKFNSDKSR